MRKKVNKQIFKFFDTLFELFDFSNKRLAKDETLALKLMLRNLIQKHKFSPDALKEMKNAAITKFNKNVPNDKSSIFYGDKSVYDILDISKIEDEKMSTSASLFFITWITLMLPFFYSVFLSLGTGDLYGFVWNIICSMFFGLMVFFFSYMFADGYYESVLHDLFYSKIAGMKEDNEIYAACAIINGIYTIQYHKFHREGTLITEAKNDDGNIFLMFAERTNKCIIQKYAHYTSIDPEKSTLIAYKE